MVLKATINPDIQLPDPALLPFFEKTLNAKRFLYYCWRIGLGAESACVVITEQDDGTVTQFVYHTGKLRRDSRDLRQYVDSKLGTNRYDSEKLYEAIDEYYRTHGLTPEVLEQEMLDREPLVNSETTVPVETLDSLLKLANTITVGAKQESIPRAYDRFVINDGENIKDFDSWHELTGEQGQLRHSIEKLIESYVRGESKKSTFAPRIDTHILIIATVVSLGTAVALAFVPGAIVAIVFCQFPLLTRAFRDEFRGLNYVLSNEICVFALALCIGYLFD